jgi:hypothetical protein
MKIESAMAHHITIDVKPEDDAKLGYVIVINRKSNDPKGIFDLDELTSYL